MGLLDFFRKKRKLKKNDVSITDQILEKKLLQFQTLKNNIIKKMSTIHPRFLREVLLKKILFH